ncbi:hypothetical protein [Microbaculum marinum]|uniref:Uncharacterized protein n=1 Tax=Microbaculum marinum TaxID=1764581 RepID=A0AAW9RSF6_9HYPH
MTQKIHPTRRTPESEQALHTEVIAADRPVTTTTGRQDEPADVRSPDEMPEPDEMPDETEPGEYEPDDLWKATRSRPVSETTARRGETVDGLDDTEEAVRREAEDRKLPDSD